MDLYNASSQSTSRHFASLCHIILTAREPFFVLAPPCCVLSGEVTNASFIVFGLTPSNPWSTLIDYHTITTTPPRRISVKCINTVKHIGPGILLPLLIKFSTWDILSKMPNTRLKCESVCTYLSQVFIFI